MKALATVPSLSIPLHTSRPISRQDMLRSSLLERSLPAWQATFGIRQISPVKELSARESLIRRLPDRVNSCSNKHTHKVQSYSQQSNFRSSMFRSSQRPSHSSPTDAAPYGLFLNTGQGGFTPDGKFRKRSSVASPPQAAASGALPAPSEDDPSVMRPLTAFEGLLGTAGAAPHDADVTKGVVESAADVSKGEILEKGRSVSGVKRGRLLEAWEVADEDSRFAEYQRVYLHYKVKMPAGQGEFVPFGGVPKDARDEEGRLVRKFDRLGGGSGSGENTPLKSVNTSSSEELVTRHETGGKNLAEAASTSGRTALPAIFLHGFGASLFSWEKVLQAVADVTGGPALAFDRPAFGLSARAEPKGLPVNPYSQRFSAAATLAFVDFLGADKAVLVGHSAGSDVAFSAYFQNPEKVAAIILVAPATFPRAVNKPDSVPAKPAESPERVPFWKLPWVWVTRAAQAVATAAKWVVKTFRRGLGVCGLALAAIIVRSKLAAWALRLILNRVGEAGVRNAWYDSEACTQDVLDAYKKPMTVRGWERALLEFVLATMGGSPGSDLPLGRRLGEVKCPVLVVSGDSDRIVPVWNAKKVAEMLPNAQLRVIERCGHLPQEEKPEQLLSAIAHFLRERVAGGAAAAPAHAPVGAL